MKERPILFSSKMVKAILLGLKTQTRRAVEFAPSHFYNNLSHFQDQETGHYTLEATRWNNKWALRQPAHSEIIRTADFDRYSKIEIGDLLYVRENWFELKNGQVDRNTGFPVWYMADFEERVLQDFRDLGDKWRPSIHLLKCYSRIWLEVVDIRIEPLFSISKEDALAEGIERWPSSEGKWTEYQSYLKPVPVGSRGELAPQNSYLELWEAINGKKSVNSNPWVWVLSFKVLSTTGRPFIT